VLEISVDGGTPDTVRIPAGRENVLLGRMEAGEHTFHIRKISGGDFVRLYSVTLDGTFLSPDPTAVENGVTVVVSAPAAGCPLGSFTVYVQTSHESGEYCVEYPFAYQRRLGKNPYEGNWSDPASGNKQYNVNMYRVDRSYITKKSGSSFTRLYQVLQNGEIGMAIMETAVGNDGVTEAGKAGDFIGGFHGDETLIDTPVLLLDGTPVDLSRRGTYTGTTLTFVQRTHLDRCNMTGQHVATHSQIVKLDTNGMRVKRSVTFLADNFAVRKGNSFLQMFTFARQDLLRMSAKEYGAADLSNTVNLLDAAGNILHTVDTAAFEVRDADGKVTPFPAKAHDGKDIIAQYHFYGNDVKNRYAEHLGEGGNGIYAKVGFHIVDASVKVESACIAVRRDITPGGGVHGDNKWYPSFTSVNDPTVCLSSLGVNAQNKAGVTHAGETWNLDLIYYIDYNPES